MGLQDYDPESIDEDDPKVQALVFPNPHHEEMEEHINNEELAEEFYYSVRWLKQRLGHQANIPFGKFASAVVKAEKDDDYEELEDLVETLKGEDDA